MSPRRRGGLDPKALANLPTGDHNDGAGLLLRVFESGARTWMLRYRKRSGTGREKQQRRLRLGELGGPLALDLEALGLSGPDDFQAPPALTLAAARVVAQAIAGLAARGIDPLEQLKTADQRRQERETEAARRKAEGTMTLDALLDRFMEARSKGDRPVRPNTLALWESLARAELRPAFGKNDPRGIARSDVKNWHRAIGATGRTTWANRAVELLKAVYAWAVVEEELLDSSPVVNIKPFKERARDRVLKHDELKAVWEALALEPEHGDAFRLLLWSAARRSEVLGLEWAEIDFKARTWRIPAERSKTELVRTIPLTKPALEMLQARRSADPKGRWVFPSPVTARGPLGSLQAPFRRVVARSGVTGWTIHDLRRTARTELSALGVEPYVAEAILGHARPKSERVYNRAEPLAKMRAALEAWARRLAAIVSGEKTDADVLPFTG